MAWCVEIYAFDGTHIVVDRLAGRQHPFYRVYGPGGPGNDSIDDRMKMAEDLRDHLRGEAVPKWLHDMERPSRCTLLAADGAIVAAVGPFIEQTEGKITRFVQCMSDDAVERRILLIDQLLEARDATS